ncbi:MAG TPA: transglutaminase-like domain-containing protein [Pedobacter sp.]|jgi:transglutaminase-like putative cysteine protease
MSKKYLMCIALWCSAHLTNASTQDSTIEIASAVTVYRFEKNEKLNSIEILEKSNTVYVSTTANNQFTVAERYDDQERIDKVELKIDGRIPFNFKPEHSYYSVENIFYSDAKICYFPVKLPKVGSTAKVEFEKITKDPRYFTSIYLISNYFTKTKEVNITVPRWMKVEFKEMNFATYDIKKTSRYDARLDADIITYRLKDIAASNDESNSPGPSYMYPHLMVLCKSATVNNQNVTYFNTLSDLYSWYRSLVKDPENDIPTLKEKAVSLTKDSKSDFEKIKAVFYYVQESIRYIAFEDGIAGFKPEKAHEVLRKKYGDCKGMAHLTKELLKALGFDARLCWLGTKHIAYSYETPSMAVDNHMICALNYKGKTYFLDPTESYIGFNEYAERIQGRQVLIEDGDKFILSKVPKADVSQNFNYEKRVLSISGSSLTGKVSHKWKGEEKEALLSNLNRIKKEKSETAFVKYLSNHNSDLVVNNLITSNLSDLDNDLTASYDIEHKGAVNAFNKDYYIDLDFRKELAELVIETTERKHDYWFDYKSSILRETELILPENYQVTSIPPNLSIKTSDYDFDLEFNVVPGKVIYKKTILLKNPNLSKSKFSEWNTNIEKLKKSYNESLILKQKI